MTRLGLAPFIVVVALVAVACGGSDAETSSSSTSTTSPDSGASTTSGNAAETTTSSDPTFVIADSCHDGSSDATFDDSGGVYATLLTAIDPTERSLSFDVVQWLVGEDAVDAWQEEHPDDPEGPPNGTFMKNDNPAVRTAPVAADVVVHLVRLDEDADADLDPGTFDELPTYLDNQPSVDGYISPNPYWLTFDAGEITGVCEQFTP